jgi:hypothetical protein
MTWIFGAALLFGVSLIVMGLLGNDSDADVAADGDAWGDAGLFAVFSLRNLTWASFAFGGIGLLAVLTERTPTTAILSATAAGVVTLVGVHALFRALRRSEAGSEPLDVSLVGAPGILVLPFDDRGLGVVSFRANGQVQELPARRAPDVMELDSRLFTACRIEYVEDGIAVVHPVTQS